MSWLGARKQERYAFRLSVPYSGHSAHATPVGARSTGSLDAFGKAVFADRALTTKMKQIIAVAVAHVTQCPYCIRGHTKAAVRAGATQQQLMEAIWVAAEVRAGGAYAHAALMITEAEETKGEPRSD